MDLSQIKRGKCEFYVGHIIHQQKRAITVTKNLQTLILLTHTRTQEQNFVLASDTLTHLYITTQKDTHGSPCVEQE